MLVAEEIGLRFPFKVSEFGRARNQFTIRFAGNEYFQSYDSIIGMKDRRGRIFLDETYWNYSKTTGKYRNKWLGEDGKETKRKIDKGIYTLINLNE